MEKQKASETIKMVGRALGVLDLLRVSKTPLGVNEIAKQADLNPSTTFRILKTLEESGWVFQLRDDRYIVGEKISFVTEKNNFYLALSDVSKLIMEGCTKQYGQAMNLMVRDGIHCTILQQSRTDRLIDYVPPINAYLPFYACAGGKILLSELPVDMVEFIMSSVELEPLTPYTITRADQYWKALHEASRLGYAFDNQESTLNGSCLAVPVRNNTGEIIASLSFSGFVGVDNPDDLLKYLPALQEASKEITKNLYKIWNG